MTKYSLHRQFGPVSPTSPFDSELLVSFDPPIILDALINKMHFDLEALRTSSPGHNASLDALASIYEIWHGLAILCRVPHRDVIYRAEQQAEYLGPLLTTWPGGMTRAHVKEIKD